MRPLGREACREMGETKQNRTLNRIAPIRGDTDELVWRGRCQRCVQTRDLLSPEAGNFREEQESCRLRDPLRQPRNLVPDKRADGSILTPVQMKIWVAGKKVTDKKRGSYK